MAKGKQAQVTTPVAPPNCMTGDSMAAGATAPANVALGDGKAVKQQQLTPDASQQLRGININQSIEAESPLDGEDLDAFDYDSVGAAAATGSTSAINSINNSTENLSFASDIFYPEDLMLIAGADDDDEQSSSFNSDDCVYAYRGGNAELGLVGLPVNYAPGHFELAPPPAVSTNEDETDFLEMDFEPDPPSENDATAPYIGDNNSSGQNDELYLMLRDLDEVSGRHSAGLPLQAARLQRPLFSSPVDDPQPQDALQAQSRRLNKDFGRISLHLDQIKDDADDVADAKTSCQQLMLAAGSLPNTMLNTQYNCLDSEAEASAKYTGAKPKRLSAGFSTSSSISSKNSSKSRISSRTSYAPGCHVPSFDERCASCTDFRECAPQRDEDCPMPPMLATNGATPTTSACTAAPIHCRLDFNVQDETCLDCLEKEFLANTIGKAIDPNRNCIKCQRKRASSASLYARHEFRCRSGSPDYRLPGLRDECIFNESSVAMLRQHSDEWQVPRVAAVPPRQQLPRSSYNLVRPQPLSTNQRIFCDNDNCLRLTPEPPPPVERLNTANLEENTLLQCLDKLGVHCDTALIRAYFAELAQAQQTGGRGCKNLRTFILHFSKLHCNYKKLSKLIHLATQQRVRVEFQKANLGNEIELVPINVSDLLYHCTPDVQLNELFSLDVRFQSTNLLGKIANLIRQSKLHAATRRPLPESIMIPQYYPSGELTLTKVAMPASSSAIVIGSPPSGSMR